MVVGDALLTKLARNTNNGKYNCSTIIKSKDNTASHPSDLPLLCNRIE